MSEYSLISNIWICISVTFGNTFKKIDLLTIGQQQNKMGYVPKKLSLIFLADSILLNTKTSFELQKIGQNFFGTAHLIRKRFIFFFF